MSDQPVIGVDLGGTNMQIGLVDHHGKLLARAKAKTKAKEGLDSVLDRLEEKVRALCERQDVDLASGVGGLGIGAPGPVNPETGTVLEAVNLRWTDVNLRGLLHDRLKIPVHADNDVNVAIFGEYTRGAGRGAQHILGCWLGTGVGGGLILGGELYHGGFFTAGEIGHTVLLPGAPSAWKTLEQNCSRTAIVDQLTRLIKANEPSMIWDLVHGELSRIKSGTLAEAYLGNDELTVKVVHEVADLIGMSLASVVTLLSLERIVLGGGLTEAIGEPLVSRITDSLREHVFPDRCKQVEVVASELEDDAGVIGAAMLARRSLGLEQPDARPAGQPTN